MIGVEPTSLEWDLPIEDRKMPFLRITTDSAMMRPVLSNFMPQKGNAALTIGVLKYVAGERCVLLYERGSQRMVGKVYRTDHGARVYRIMRMLREGQRGFAIPAAYAYLPGLHLLLQEAIPGRLSLLVEEALLRRIGTSLAQFHQSGLSLGRNLSMEDHIRDLIHPHPQALAKACPRFRPLIDACIKNLEDDFRRLSRSHRGPVHRDFHLRQIFKNGDRLWLSDFDHGGQSDPVLDAGNFAVYLETHLERSRWPLVHHFLAGYLSALDSPHRVNIGQRLSLYMSFTYLRLASKRYRLRGARGEDGVEEMLNKAVETMP